MWRTMGCYKVQVWSWWLDRAPTKRRGIVSPHIYRKPCMWRIHNIAGVCYHQRRHPNCTGFLDNAIFGSEKKCELFQFVRPIMYLLYFQFLQIIGTQNWNLFWYFLDKNPQNQPLWAEKRTSLCCVMPTETRGHSDISYEFFLNKLLKYRGLTALGPEYV